MNEEKKTCVKCGHAEPHSFNSFIDPERTHECGHPGCMCRDRRPKAKFERGDVVLYKAITAAHLLVVKGYDTDSKKVLFYKAEEGPPFFQRRASGSQMNSSVEEFLVKVGHVALEDLPDYEPPVELPTSIADKIKEDSFGCKTGAARELVTELYRELIKGKKK